MLNQTTIMGRLVKDPDLRQTNNGTSVASFTLACERDFSTDGKRETDFFPVVAWRQSAEFVSKYMTKGMMIAVTGRLQNRSYTDKDGNKRTITEIVADNYYFCEKKTERSESYDSDLKPAAAPTFATADDVLPWD